MASWQLQEAKARLSELIKSAAKEGPQKITVRGETTAVLISNEDYERLKHPKGSFIKFMRSSPLYGLDINPRREQTLTRNSEVS